MRLESRSEYDAPVEAVETALVDPVFWSQLRLANLAPPQVISSAADRITVHIAWAGTLDALGRRVVGSEGIAWNQTITIDRAAHTGTLALASKVRVNVTADGTFRFDALAGGAAPRTRQTLSGRITVHVPLLGAKIEGILGPGIQRSFDEQAASLRNWLTRG